MAEALGTLGFGVVMLVAGGLLVTDFRGMTRWYTRFSLDFARPLTGAFRRRETPEKRAERIAYGVLVTRIVGGIFAALGGFLIFIGVPWLLGAVAVKV
ncbi:hypothetical protein [Actinoplanes subtropicus]|uniref:hypothetical protein n=1 Tax=Actinoplanes subtropicus TaxID=543632 RepID=UPI0004C371EE|nr:hypothetical protein [Actinoplanes subtropicus]